MFVQEIRDAAFACKFLPFVCENKTKCKLILSKHHIYKCDSCWECKFLAQMPKSYKFPHRTHKIPLSIKYKNVQKKQQTYTYTYRVQYFYNHTNTYESTLIRIILQKHHLHHFEIINPTKYTYTFTHAHQKPTRTI